jgi:peptidoglycan-N-acetylglucosamine deacetylase
MSNSVVNRTQRLTLTFDNGPDPDVTPLVLDELARRNIKTTFFVLGKHMADPGLRALAERARSEGHWIGNHTYFHEIPLGEQTEPGAAGREIRKTDALIGGLAQPSKLFRPFGGGGNLDKSLLNAEACDYLKAEGFTCVLWNSIPRDWENPDGWVETAIAQLDESSWPLMVLHDLATGAMRHLSRFLDIVTARGIDVVQDFPEDCIAMEDGRPTVLLQQVLTTAPHAPKQ